MKTFKVLALIAVTLAIIPGCNNLSPRDNFSPQMEQRLKNIEGDQATLENNQNAIKIELGRLQNSTKIDGENNQVQQGWLNFKGDGLFVGIFGIVTIGMLLIFMYKSAKYKKIANIMGEQIKFSDNIHLKEQVIASAWNTGLERDVFRLIE